MSLYYILRLNTLETLRFRLLLDHLGKLLRNSKQPSCHLRRRQFRFALIDPLLIFADRNLPKEHLIDFQNKPLAGNSVMPIAVHDAIHGHFRYFDEIFTASFVDFQVQPMQQIRVKSIKAHIHVNLYIA